LGHTSEIMLYVRNGCQSLASSRYWPADIWAFTTSSKRTSTFERVRLAASARRRSLLFSLTKSFNSLMDMVDEAMTRKIVENRCCLLRQSTKDGTLLWTFQLQILFVGLSWKRERLSRGCGAPSSRPRVSACSGSYDALVSTTRMFGPLIS